MRLLCTPPILGAFLLASACQTIASRPRIRPGEWSRPIVDTAVENWYRADAGLFRSAQPDAEDMRELAAFGIREVLNLRSLHDDIDEAEGTGLRLHRIPMEAGAVTEDQLV